QFTQHTRDLPGCYNTKNTVARDLGELSTSSIPSTGTPGEG
ncbi:MAG: hypothetical protein JWP03_3445, partial [Phycisphaerales bacterium]|nr:hypothetical protein [Phycisphaerales bacterium]